MSSSFIPVKSITILLHEPQNPPDDVGAKLSQVSEHGLGIESERFVFIAEFIYQMQKRGKFHKYGKKYFKRAPLLTLSCLKAN
jgi:hypothetical protein